MSLKNVPEYSSRENVTQQREHRIPQLDQTLASLLTDLEDSVLLDATLVTAIGEFGRTSDANSGGEHDGCCQCWSLTLWAAEVALAR